MRVHNWTQDRYIGPAIIDGLNFVTVVQGYVCRSCGETISLPDCNKLTCRIFLSLECPGSEEKPRIERKKVQHEEETNTKDYPAKRSGHEAKRRKR